MSVRRGVTTMAVTGLLALGVAACGSSGGSLSSGASGGSSGKSSSGSVPTVPLKAGESPIGQTLTGAAKKRGGTLTVYTSEDFEHLDPGESYFTERLRRRSGHTAAAVLLQAQHRQRPQRGPGHS